MGDSSLGAAMPKLAINGDFVNLLISDLRSATKDYFSYISVKRELVVVLKIVAIWLCGIPRKLWGGDWGEKQEYGRELFPKCHKDTVSRLDSDMLI